ncbi:hypothetical protein MHYP_G00328330 [Metynnis hypsauchen]
MAVRSPAVLFRLVFSGEISQRCPANRVSISLLACVKARRQNPTTVKYRESRETLLTPFSNEMRLYLQLEATGEEKAGAADPQKRRANRCKLRPCPAKRPSLENNGRDVSGGAASQPTPLETTANANGQLLSLSEFLQKFQTKRK